jgi:hypothetical protein
MNFVLDASAAVPASVPEPWMPKALQLFDNYRKGIEEPVAPDLP